MLRSHRCSPRLSEATSEGKWKGDTARGRRDLRLTMMILTFASAMIICTPGNDDRGAVHESLCGLKARTVRIESPTWLQNAWKVMIRIGEVRAIERGMV